MVNALAPIMRPQPGAAAGGSDEVRMVLRNPAVVNGGQVARRRDRFDGPELAVVAAKQLANRQVLDRRPTPALDPEGMRGRRLDLMPGHLEPREQRLGAEDLLDPLPGGRGIRIELVLRPDLLANVEIIPPMCVLSIGYSMVASSWTSCHSSRSMPNS